MRQLAAIDIYLSAAHAILRCRTATFDSERQLVVFVLTLRRNGANIALLRNIEGEMAQSNAERQAAYRKRQQDGEGERLNMVISPTAGAALKRLAAHHGATQRRVLEVLLAEAEAVLLSTLSPAEQSDYYRLGK